MPNSTFGRGPVTPPVRRDDTTTTDTSAVTDLGQRGGVRTDLGERGGVRTAATTTADATAKE